MKPNSVKQAFTVLTPTAVNLFYVFEESQKKKNDKFRGWRSDGESFVNRVL